jgi:hypothetical protein
MNFQRSNMKDQYYKPQYHGDADNAYVERFWKTREAYPITPALIMVGINDDGTPDDDTQDSLPDEGDDDE